MHLISWDSYNSNDETIVPICQKYVQSIEKFLNNNINKSFDNSLHIMTDNKVVSMDDSEDNKNKRKTPFERVNHSTNFEDYACTSDDTKFLFTSNSLVTNGLNYNISTSKPMHETNKDSFSQSINKMSNKTKFESSVTPIISSYLSDQRDHSFKESCLSAGNSSAEVTPSGTPQSSPYTSRKAIDSNNKVKILKNEKNNNLLSLNPKRWFYTGFFLNNENMAQHKPIINDKPNNTITKNASFKNLCVSNFDINAVGPTSW